MKITLKTRKPINHLTVEDFAAFPIWEYASNEEDLGGDETWVRPVDAPVVPTESYVHVAAEFTAACGQKLSGDVTVSTLEGPPNACQGSIFHDGKGWFVSNPEAICYRESRDELIAALGLTEDAVFPLSFRLRIPVEGVPGFWSGVLP